MKPLWWLTWCGPTPNYSKRLATEIVSAPKVYAFDTGFVAFAQGWHELSPDCAGILFEHWVLNEFHSVSQGPCLNYWRDKSGHEIDFVWKRRGQDPVAIECKWDERKFDTNNLRSFRNRHPKGANILIAANAKGQKDFSLSGFKITCLGPDALADWIGKKIKNP